MSRNRRQHDDIQGEETKEEEKLVTGVQWDEVYILIYSYLGWQGERRGV